MLIAGTRCSGQERAEEQVGAQSREVRIIPLLSCRGNGPTMFQCSHFVITYLMQPFWNKQYFSAASNTIKFPMFLLLSNLLDRQTPAPHPQKSRLGWGLSTIWQENHGKLELRVIHTCSSQRELSILGHLFLSLLAFILVLWFLLHHNSAWSHLLLINK